MNLIWNKIGDEPKISKAIRVANRKFHNEQILETRQKLYNENKLWWRANYFSFAKYLDELTILEWKDIGDRRSILEPKKIIIILMFTWWQLHNYKVYVISGWKLYERISVTSEQILQGKYSWWINNDLTKNYWWQVD